MKEIDEQYMLELRQNLLDVADALRPDNIEPCKHALRSIALGLIPESRLKEFGAIECHPGEAVPVVKGKVREKLPDVTFTWHERTQILRYIVLNALGSKWPINWEAKQVKAVVQKIIPHAVAQNPEEIRKWLTP